MVRTGLTETGAEEWLCPACGRRMLMRWPPHFETLVLESGDSTAVHGGAKGGALMPAVDMTQVPRVPADEQQWLRQNGIDWDGLAS
jgi:hypothetical protein